MAEQAIHEMVSAFAVGCMDKQNFVQFKDYIAEGGDLPEGELGELQNVVSMIPVILDLEKPHDSIKDMVARKLIGMKEEIKAKILNDRKTLVNTFTQGQTIANLPDSLTSRPLASTRIKPKLNTVDFKTQGRETPLSFDSSKDDFTNRFGEADLFKNTSTKLGSTPPPPAATELNESTKDVKEEIMLVNTPKIVETPPVEEQKTSSGWMSILGIILTILLCTILGYYTFISTQKLDTRLDEIQSELNSMRSQLATANSFVGSNASLVEFFNYKDINVVNLVSPEVAGKAAAKILLSFNEKEGLIQFKNYSRLEIGKAFQLWVISKGQTYPAGVYQPIASEYIKIAPFPFLPKEQIDSYKITIEPASGSTSASSNVVLVSEALPGRKIK